MSLSLIICASIAASLPFLAVDSALAFGIPAATKLATSEEAPDSAISACLRLSVSEFGLLLPVSQLGRESLRERVQLANLLKSKGCLPINSKDPLPNGDFSLKDIVSGHRQLLLKPA